MLSTFIVENYAIVRLLMVLALAAAVVVAALLVHRQRTATILAGVGLFVVLLLTLTPDANPLPAQVCNFESYTPFGDDFNILLFLVPALFAVVATRHPLIVLGGGMALSASIEFVQYLVPWFGRRCDVDDWLANSLGTLIGVALAVGVSAVARWWDRRRKAPAGSA